MSTFLYTPQVKCYVEAGGSFYNKKATKPKTYDISDDLVSGTLTRRVDGVSDFSFNLLNAERKYDQVFTPNDRITVLMKRLTWVRVFTGYLNKVPLMTAWPRDVSLTASCSLKRLQYWYWDPEASATQQMIMNALGQSGVNGTNSDGGMTNVLLTLLSKVVGWPNSKVHVAQIPSDWFAFAQTIAKSVEASAEESDALAQQFFSSLGGAGSVAGGAGTTTAGSNSVSGALGSKQGEFGAVGCRNAELIFSVGVTSGASTSDQIVALMTAMQESTLGENPSTNTPNAYGAVGVFQQQWKLSEWGGSLASCLDVSASAKRFFDHLSSMISASSRATMPKGQQANTVQRAGASQTANFQKWESKATSMVNIMLKASSAKTSQGQTNTTPAPTSTGATGYATSDQFVQGAKDFVATYPSVPYTEKYGGTQIKVISASPPPGLDCSSFVQAIALRVLGNLYDFNTARVVSQQRTICKIIDVKTALNTPGALLFNGSAHVEISIGDGKHSVGSHHTGTFASVEATSASYWTDGGLVPRVTYGALGMGGGSTTGGTTNGSGATNSAQGSIFTDQYSSLPGYNASDPFDKLFGDAHWAPLNVKNTDDAAYNLAQALTGIKSLLNDQPLLPYLKNLFSASMRSFCSAPNGDLIAWFPDYYGLWGTAAKMVVQPIEVKDFAVDWDDSFFVTHQFTATTPSGGALQNGLDVATGTVSPLTAYSDPLVLAQTLAYTRGIASIDVPALMYALFKVNATQAESAAFAQWIYNRFGARPDFQQLPNLVGPSAEFFAAIYFFMRQWAYQYNADIPLTFMPELFPGMLIQIPAFSFQGYVNTVTHQFQFGPQGGFTTQVNISAPARLSANGNGADVLIGMPNAGGFMGGK
jgi:hypothetical protein